MPRTIVTQLYQQLALPVISAPMFIVSGPELLIAQCASGIIGSMPALNARPQSKLAEWLTQIDTALAELKRREPGRIVAPYAINHIIHKSNDRLLEDLAVCADHKVPFIITSLRAPNDVVDAVHGWGGKVFHDVTTMRHARKALDAGVDGLILVCSGAGGHAGTLSPFALLAEVRKIFDGPIALSGAISRGHDVLAARAMGADFAYIGTRFIASHEAQAQDAYKQMLVDAQANDILYTPFFTGIPGNYLKPSIAAAGLDPDTLASSNPDGTNFGSTRTKAWRDIWGAGQGVGSIDSISSVATIVEKLKYEYREAYTALGDSFTGGQA
ncbi:nitronate monooxygenase [Pollutimonas nitritireducens]|uniref:Nitronate monooxygenase n=1 Tax=Pollutimonas nitritireducens TaxID=2045209 RepID=A0A2N4UH96_9BURK|nr:nitronate monooxygenase family protein [Pollutimonas nitritireducens]PLC54402.1 nitronate monooxygenase [Pollutimonas nitritireducens]